MHYSASHEESLARWKWSWWRNCFSAFLADVCGTSENLVREYKGNERMMSHQKTTTTHVRKSQANNELFMHYLYVLASYFSVSLLKFNNNVILYFMRRMRLACLDAMKTRRIRVSGAKPHRYNVRVWYFEMREKEVLEKFWDMII